MSSRSFSSLRRGHVPTRLPLVLGALIACLLPFAPIISAADPIVSVPGSGSTTIAIGPGATSVELLVQASAAVDPATLEAEPVGLRLGSEVLPFNQISATVVDRAGLRAIQLTLPAIPKPGTYELTLLLSAAAAPAAVASPQPGASAPPSTAPAPARLTQLLGLSLVRSATVLPVPAAVVITKTDGLGSFGSSEDGAVIRSNLSGESGLTGVHASQLGQSTIDGRTVGAVLVPAVGRELPPGPFEISLGLEGDWPLGTTKAEVLLGANELGADLVYPVEVRRRLHWIWLIAFALAGLVLGLAVRKVVQWRVDEDTAHLALAEAMAAVDDEIASSADAAYWARLRQIRNRLWNARSANAADATTAAATGQDELAAARTEFETSLAAVDAEVRTLAATVALPWRVDPEGDALLAAASKGIAAAGARVRARDQQTAATLLAGATHGLVSGLEQRCTAIDIATRPFRDAVADASRKPPLPNASLLRYLAGEMGTAIATAVPDDAKAPAAWLDRLEGLTWLTRQAEIGLRGAADIGRRTVEALPEGAAPDGRQVLEAAEELGAVVDVAPLDFMAALDCLAVLAGALDALLTGNGQAARELAGQGRFVEAAQRLTTVASDSGRQVGPPALLQEISFPAMATRVYLAGEQPSHLPPTPGHAAQRVNALRRRVLSGQVILTALLSIPFLFVSYALYSPDWIGQPGQIATVFLWAFGFDLTVSAIHAAASPVKPAP